MAGSKKSVFLINFEYDESELGDELKSLLENDDVAIFSATAGSFALDFGGDENNNKILFRGSVVSSSNSIFFIRKRSKKYTFLSSLLSRFLQRNNYTFLNPLFSEHQKSIGKFAQGINLSAKGYLVPRTIIVSSDNIAEYKDYIEKVMSYPLVIKGSGSGGNAVWKVSGWEEVESAVQTGIERIKDAVMFQEFIPQSQEEYRLVFFAGEMVASVRRASSDFYNNYAQGATVSTYDVPEEERQVCCEIALQSDLDYVAVDYMKNESGQMVFMEVQTGPSLDVSKIANPEVVQSIAEAFRKKFL